MADVKVNPTRIVLKNVRVSYCNLWTPKDTTNDAGEVTGTQYSCQLLVPKKDKENEQKLDSAITYIKNKEKSKLCNKAGVVPSNLKVAKRCGDTDPTYEGNEVYKDMWVVNATNKNGKPGIVNNMRQPIIDGDEIYSGIWVFASITLGAYDNDGKGIAAYINNILKVKDDERLDGRISAEDEFAAFDDEIPKDEATI
jgi:hypothetical protein